jgi:hypothetical protein
VIPGIDDILEVVSRRAEFVDDTNREIYATRLDLAKGEPGLVFLFLQKPFQA